MTEFNPITIAQDRQQVFQKLLKMTWDDFETVEFNERLLFPGTITRLRANGKREITKVMLRVPREPDMRKARLEARKWAQDIGLNPALDVDLFDNMETMCALAMSIRNTSEPYEPWVATAQELESQYDRPSLDAAWAQIEALRRLLDPRESELGDDSFLSLVAMIAERSDISPLAALEPSSQTDFIVSLASRYHNLLASKSESG